MFINMIVCAYNIVKALYIKQETQKLQRQKNNTIDEGYKYVNIKTGNNQVVLPFSICVLI